MKPGSVSRRDFIKTAAIGGTALSLPGNVPEFFAASTRPASPDLYALSAELLAEWSATLLKLQVVDALQTQDYGGIRCPSKKQVLGRMAETIYPFSYLADKTGDRKYADASVLMYRWMERTTSQDDGSWLNEPVKGSWKGTTVFTSIALAEALRHHGRVFDASFVQQAENRLKRAGDFIYDNFSMAYGNINYPVTAAYGLTLLGTLLDIPKFREKGREFAHQSLKFFTEKDHLLYGEGTPLDEPSKKGCFSVDLGYNVEESLPSLALYATFTKDEEVLEMVTRSAKAHLEFMLPDGGWDNSWGTRNYKWTYWGSRTSDGCPPAYALLAKRDPAFYTAALRNTEQLQRCTKNGMLYGGPHEFYHHLVPSIHHTFCHSKALTTVLDHPAVPLSIRQQNTPLPREKRDRIRLFGDIDTGLLSAGRFRATVTGYDREYKEYKNGHASGGALTLLWHEQAGLLVCASMNAYQLYEADNMQPDKDPLSLSLTPRIELKTGDKCYRNISDLSAKIEYDVRNAVYTVRTSAKLVDADQQHPPEGEINCRVTYVFTGNAVLLSFDYDRSAYDGEIRVIVPVISRSDEKITMLSGTSILLKKEKASIKISSNRLMQTNTVKGARIFNYVPGLEAVPLIVAGNNVQVKINVI